MVAQNLAEVRYRISSACRRCGRKDADVLLVAVTKTFGADVVRSALESGQRDFGENYARELQIKRNELAGADVRWHFIGHLQTNKVRFIAEFVHLIHTVDSERVAGEIQRQAERSGRSVDVLLEVHTTDEATKTGVAPAKVIELAKSVSRLDRINLVGLMTMGPFADDPNESRPSFRQLSDLRNRIDREGIDRVAMRHLSMGMTHDFEVAIEEGATIVRIGTAIFGRRTVTHDSTEGAL